MTEFNKVKETTSTEIKYEVIIEDLRYDFNVRKLNDEIDVISCSILKEGDYVGGMHVQHGLKSINIALSENASAIGKILDDFLAFINN